MQIFISLYTFFLYTQKKGGGEIIFFCLIQIRGNLLKDNIFFLLCHKNVIVKAICFLRKSKYVGAMYTKFFSSEREKEICNKGEVNIFFPNLLDTTLLTSMNSPISSSLPQAKRDCSHKLGANLTSSFTNWSMFFTLRIISSVRVLGVLVFCPSLSQIYSANFV